MTGARFGLVAVPLVFALVACDRVRLDENLCPVGQKPASTTVLLLDTSDPLSPKHREVFARLVRALVEPDGPPDFRIRPGDALVVYELTQDLAQVEPRIRVCNPGDPDVWPWWRQLIEGKILALRRWQRFQERVEQLFASTGSSAQVRSPIIEFLGVVVPRHVPFRVEPKTRTHLIIYSDLLQHSDDLSHYGEYPAAEAVGRSAGLRHLKVDLSGVEASLYRLERSRDARWQTKDHYYWWTKLVQSLGGEVIWQESV